MSDHKLTGQEIALIGMAGRFPGAGSIAEFWQNLKSGVESLVFFSQQELADEGVDALSLEHPDYVKSCGGLLEGKEYFDAAFFGCKPAEAEIMDPQTRIILQCAWHALEDAGCDPHSYEGLIGFYAGSSTNFLWEILTHVSGKIDTLGEFSSMLFSNRDFMSTHVAYYLGLKGPAIFVKTACSTSLVAVHLACQALLNGECDMALAGGAAVINWRRSGYLYREGMIASKDGHCRVFDAGAGGTVGGEGAGVVVLKRLAEASADRDHVQAVIKGTAVNNDGSRKLGYTAPSLDGQADVIREALLVADVEAESIAYVEAHGTGTEVGDPIEIESLNMAFSTTRRGFCRIGSVKSNIGHLDAAAGIAGLIKTVLALKHRLIPPSLHFEKPNPRIDFEGSPFIVNNGLSEWTVGAVPLRAGVSSFAIGGTNCHVIVEEAAAEAPLFREPVDRLVILSARTGTALDRMTANLAAYFKENPRVDLGDAAYTLQVGRKAMKYRRMTVCRDIAEAALSLESPDDRKVHTAAAADEDRPVVFMFSGLGGQYVNMGRELYDSELLFRETIDNCFDILDGLVDYKIKDILYPDESPPAGLPEGNGLIDRTEVAQAVVFIFEYALAITLMQWGVRPHAMIGYSFGEYTAACLAGLFSLEDALELVVQRGRLIRSAPAGAMLSVPLSRQELLPLLETFPSSSIWPAIDNGPSCIVSGPPGDIADLEAWLKEKKYLCVRLPAEHAMHSPLMETVAPQLAETVNRLELNPPRIPYISNVTGTWIGEGQAVEPSYWGDHLKSTVRFSDGLGELLKRPGSVFIEIGPGRDLCGILQYHGDRQQPAMILNLVDQAHSASSPRRYLLNRLGRLWLWGVKIDWSLFNAPSPGYRVPLPLYPFEGRRYWLEGDPLEMSRRLHSPAGEPGKRADIADWFYIPSWKRSCLSPGWNRRVPEPAGWLVLADENGVGDQLVRRLEAIGHDVVQVKRGDGFARTGEKAYTINIKNPADYNTLFKELSAGKRAPRRIVHLWSLTAQTGDVDEILDAAFYSLLHLAQAIGRQFFREPVQLVAVSHRLQRVISAEELCPAVAVLLGAVKVIPREYPNISCRSLDIVLPPAKGEIPDLLVGQIIGEFCIESSEPVAALRGDYRWQQVFEPQRFEAAARPTGLLREEGVYLITGGLGGIGIVLAEYLVEKTRARLILTGRSEFPPPEEWNTWLQAHREDDHTSGKIRTLQNIEEMGGRVLVCRADVTDAAQMEEALSMGRERFGPLNGVIHAAGLPDGGVIHLRSRESIEPILAPKIKGTLVLEQVLGETPLDFLVLCSSVSAVLGLFGQVAYCAANAFLDAFALKKSKEENFLTVSIAWDFWREVGMGVEAVERLKENRNVTDARLLLSRGITPVEGTAVFERILSEHSPQVIVSTWDLAGRFGRVGGVEMGDGEEPEPESDSFSGGFLPRPDLAVEYEAPETPFEKDFARILRTYFGFGEVGIHDNLFEYGITSLDMIHINNALQRRLGKDIPLVVMIEYPTIHGLRQYLEPAGGGEAVEERSRSAADLEKTADLLNQSAGLLRNRLKNRERK